jgi:hypothetical protein
MASSTPHSVYPQERSPGTHQIEGCVDPRTSLDDVERRKILPYWDSNTNLSAVQLVARNCTILAH